MKTKILSYRVIIEKDGKSYHGYVPTLPGCHTQGDTIDETRINLKEAIELWLESRSANNQTIPKPDVDRVEYIETFKLNYA
jgi:predicted RNase H-like HicB family nuclease